MFQTVSLHLSICRPFQKTVQAVQALPRPTVPTQPVAPSRLHPAGPPRRGPLPPAYAERPEPAARGERR